MTQTYNIIISFFLHKKHLFFFLLSHHFSCGVKFNEQVIDDDVSGDDERVLHQLYNNSSRIRKRSKVWGRLGTEKRQRNSHSYILSCYPIEKVIQ